MFELFVEVLGEFLIQVFVEVLAHFGIHSFAEPFRRKPDPWLAAVGYAVFGAIAGGLSLLVVSQNLVPPPWRVANLVATPIVVGGVMVAIGAWRARRGQPVLRIDRFAYGYLFALSFGVIRYLFAA